LTALSGEVELTLRRERSAGEYREALGRIGQSISDMVGLTQDLALLTRTTGILDPPPTANLNDILASILSGRPPEGSGGLRIDEAIEPTIVAGDGTLLARGLGLLVDHALRHRRAGGTVHIRGARPGELVVAQGVVALIVGADDPGFRVQPWRAFATEGATPATDGDVRLRIAVRIVQRFGGFVGVQAGDQCDLAVCLRRAGQAV
jgi:signal transduction histidine kinase